jgi:hypothetical protein
MKSTIFILLILFFTQFSMAKNSGNTNNRNFNYTPSQFQKSDTIDRMDLRKSELNYINRRAVSHFVRWFKDATEMHWYATDEGYVVYFAQDDIQMKAIYNIEGGLVNTYSYYDKNNAPAEIKDLVRSNYYPFSIYNVVKLEENNKVAWFVKMEDHKTILVIRFFNGEPEVMESYKKSRK